MLDEQGFGQSACLLAKQEVVAVPEGDVGICMLGLGGQIEIPPVRVLLKERIQVFVPAHVEQVPVIQPRTLELPVIDGEAERLDKVQHGAGDRAGARDVSGVLRDLGLDQNYVEHKTPLYR